MSQSMYLYMFAEDFEEDGNDWNNWEKYYFFGSAKDYSIEKFLENYAIDYQFENDCEIYVANNEDKVIHKYKIQVIEYPNKYQVYKIS